MRMAGVSVLLLLGLFGSAAHARGQQPSMPSTFAPPAQLPVAETIYRLGDGVSAPKLIFSVEPEFSEKARKKKLFGNCKVSLVVDTDGEVRDVRVVHSIAEDNPPKLKEAARTLDEQAIKVVRQYRFEPAMLKGKPVAVALTVEVNFQIF